MNRFYDNNCICGEGSAHLNEAQVEKDVEGNVKYIAEMGFDGLKVRFGANKSASFLFSLVR